MQKSTWSCGLNLLASLLLSLALIGCGGGGESDSGGNGGGSDVVIDPTPAPGFELVWADEFTENSPPNWGKWTYDTGFGPDNDGWGNDEWQLYTSSEDNVHVSNGYLVITADCPAGSSCQKRDINNPITSGRIKTQGKFSIKHGKIQARIKPPSGSQTWSAFWMLGDTFNMVGWPRSGEIDVMEMHYKYSNVNTTQFAAHWYDPFSDTAECNQEIEGHCYAYDSQSFPGPLTDDFHIYEVEWDENRIIGRIDGINYFIKPINPDTMAEFNQDFFLILNVAVGGTLGNEPDSSSVWPQQMLVDYIHVYSVPAPDETAMALYSETITDIVLDYVSLQDSATRGWGGDGASYDLANMDVAPLEGDYALAIDLLNYNAGWGGSIFEFNSADISDYEFLVFSLNASALPNGFGDLVLALNDGSVNVERLLSSYSTTTQVGNWTTYKVPLSAFTGVDLSTIKYLGFWHFKDSSGEPLYGKIYMDNIYFLKETCGNGAVSFDSDSYFANSPQATVTVSDFCAKKSSVTLSVDNGTDAIPVDMWVKPEGYGLATINFDSTGSTDATTDTIAIANNDTLRATYIDGQGVEQTATAAIGPPGIEGCMDPDAANYDDTVQVDDGSCTYNINFTVNMNCSTQAEATAVNVQMATFGWDPNAVPLTDPDGDGVWTGSKALPPGSYEYIFMDLSSSVGEDLIDDMQNGGTCAPATDYQYYANRVATVVDAPVTVEGSFGSCDNCLVAYGCRDKDAANYNPNANTDDLDNPCLYNVNFAVDMGCFGESGAAYAKLDYYGWDINATPLYNSAGSSVWRGTYALPPGDYEYVYQAGSTTENLYDDMSGGASCAPVWGSWWDWQGIQQFYANRVVSVTDAPVSLADTFDTCSTCSGKNNVVFSVDMNCYEGDTNEGVKVTGLWCGWGPDCALSDSDGDGVWTGTYQFVPATSESEYQYKYMIGDFNPDEWLYDDMTEQGGSCAPVYGYYWDNGDHFYANRVVPADSPVTLLSDTFDTCGVCAPNPTLEKAGCTDESAANYDPEAVNDDGSCLYTVTLSVDMNCSGITDPYNQVSVSGTFCQDSEFNWCGGDVFPLTDDGGGFWSGSIDLPKGITSYKYIVDDWTFDEDLIGDTACAPDTDGNNYANRQIDVQGPISRDETYGQCTACVSD